MRVHLIRTKDVHVELLEETARLINEVPGPIKAIPAEGINYMEVWSPTMLNFDIKSIENHNLTKGVLDKNMSNVRNWDIFYRGCKMYRRKKRIPADDMIVLLTNVDNHQNWFSALDFTDGKDGFIHTRDWDQYVDSPPAFPIAYEVVSLLVQQHLFQNISQFSEYIHYDSIGCINDFCQDKRSIILKLRTADICARCLDLFTSQFPMPVIDQVLSIMESLRRKMLFAQGFRAQKQHSKLVIDQDFHIWLEDYNKIEIKLTPLEKTLYLLFLRYPDGITKCSLQDYRDEILQIYSLLKRSTDQQKMQDRINDICSPLSNSADEKISKIKLKFTNALGAGLAAPYYIQGPVGEAKKIRLDRNLVKWDGLQSCTTATNLLTTENA
jgi:hypothetical protein